MHHVTAFLTGALFSVGLAISGMIRPSKVEGFLDISKDWDPTLMFVMGGAIVVFLPLYRLIMKRRERPLLWNKFDIHTSTEITRPLVIGSIMFGVGWGISGFCPAAAFTALPALSSSAIGVAIGMALGIIGMRTMRSVLAPQAAPTAADF